ncbi:LytS/YhcK type 5TM receptor domain-containing protein, partial [Pantoea sp. SIMBA_133]
VVDDNFILDFRRIPFILGALYGGKWVAFSYLFITLAYRFTLGGTGFYSTLLSFTLLTIVASIVSSKFLKYSLKKKLLVAASIDLMV